MKQIVKELLDAENLTCEKVEAAIKSLESQGCGWRDLGDKEGNHARVNITANPDSTIIERITNAMDAVLERNALVNPAVLEAKSPREAVSKIFGFKGGYLCNVSTGKGGQGQMEVAEKSGVEVFARINGTANLFFRDPGIGLTSEEMPGTILSLNESNKFRKLYVIGQYGQGGSTTCAFSKYTVMVTRKVNANPDHIAFTIIRFNDLSDDPLAKDGKFEYIVLKSNNNPPYISPDGIDFPAGTYVGHMKYDIAKTVFYDFWQIMDHYLFDPPLPYTLSFDKWKTGSRRSLLGARRRIETSSLKQYSEEFTYKIKDDPQHGEVKIRYYLLKSHEEKEKKGKKILEPVKAGRFLYDEKNSILITYNGQVQGCIPRMILNEQCKFGYIYKSLIVQVECEGLTATGKKYFFTSGRDRLKKPAENEITEAIIAILSKDENLRKENELREQQALSEHIGKDTSEVRRKLAEMLTKLNPGKFKVKLGDRKEKIGTGTKKSSGGGGSSVPLLPLPTKGEPTFIQIANKQDPIPLRKGRTCKISIESDAPDGLLSVDGWSLALSDDSSSDLQIHSRSDFRGGRLKVFLRTDTGKVGSKLSVKLSLRHTDGRVMDTSVRTIEVLDSTATSRTSEIEINAPQIVELTEKDQKYEEYGWTEQTVAEVKEGAQTVIYVNMSNRYLVNTLTGASYAEARVNRIRSQYLLHIAYHSFIQHLGFKEHTVDLPEDHEETIKKAELDRVARTVCTTIMAAPVE